MKTVGVVHGGIASTRARNDGFRLSVVTDDTKIECVIGVYDANLGPFGGRIALVGRGLYEIGCDGRDTPNRFVQYITIDDWSCLDRVSSDGSSGCRCRLVWLG